MKAKTIVINCSRFNTIVQGQKVSFSDDTVLNGKTVLKMFPAKGYSANNFPSDVPNAPIAGFEVIPPDMYQINLLSKSGALLFQINGATLYNLMQQSSMPDLNLQDVSWSNSYVQFITSLNPTNKAVSIDLFYN